MDILNTLTLKSNRQIKINFDGGDLSSDAGLLLIKEFAAKIGFTRLVKKKFKTNDKVVHFHKDDENLMQMIYMEHFTAAMMQINLWNLSFRNTWKEVLKHIFVVTVDFHLLSFIKPVR
ncbi:hypothetical protein ASU35_12550 [Acetivibrio ethanolgignens]|uniref:Transposase DDE domain-containing protein n=1 Tax=Acetivibrio ethanolgignens TaxID=290052 RepID=A0A0V8QD74_9FIRM|nr:hypothetical protein ASU35_12550 [Acetivibrio ethanolgignens]